MRVKHKKNKYKKLRTTLKNDIFNILGINNRYSTDSEGYFSKTELQLVKNAIEECKKGIPNGN